MNPLADILNARFSDTPLRIGTRTSTTMEATPASGRRPLQIEPCNPRAAVDTGHAWLTEGADMLLLEPALCCADVLMLLRQGSSAPLAPFSMSGEYTRLAQDGELTLLLEVFTFLKRAGADQIITYAAADLAPMLS
ncbi:hypothetical protein [Nonomuraea basaltis]|uniref:hypothetical protein n=1 Tax=Nonomuraea basaltis TaxID=2495887 RepID=UPI00110C4D57|nr:hypothetical protein [Nonomuraea basaltis]TMR92119.1 hypothetical protein EJK15_46375 [Nonomuraea basaltis]